MRDVEVTLTVEEASEILVLLRQGIEKMAPLSRLVPASAADRTITEKWLARYLHMAAAFAAAIERTATDED